MNFKKLITELKRRNVFKVATAYIIAGWLIIQVVSSVFPIFKFPEWTSQFVVILVLIGFPIAIILAWAFEMTPDGVKRTEEVPKEESITKKTGRRLNAILAVMLILSVGGLFYQHFATDNLATTNQSTSLKTTAGSLSVPAKSIAVLPFENLSTDSSNAYFADGMQDLILTKLADVGQLEVVSRTSTQQYASHPDNLTDIAKKLKVGSILEGSVQKAANQVLINVQLIDARTDHHIWAHSYTRTLNNIFGVEGEVAQKIADALNAKLSPQEVTKISRIPTHNKEAYDTYLRATYYLDEANRTLDDKDLKQSIKLAKKATELDPDFVDAYNLLALGYAKLGGHLSEDEAATHKALALDPNNSYAHIQLAFVMCKLDKPDVAISEAKKGVRLQPESAKNYYALGYVYEITGRFHKAYTAFQQAVQMNPNNNFYRQGTADAAICLRNYAEARDTLKGSVARDPADLLSATDLVDTYTFGWGDLTAAQKVLKQVPVPVDSSATLADAWYQQYIYSGNYRAALDVLEKVRPDKFKDYDLLFSKERIYYLLGNQATSHAAGDKALRAIQSALKKRPKSVSADLYNTLALIQAYQNQRKAALQAINRSLEHALADYKMDYLATKAEILAHFGDSKDATRILNNLFQTTGSGYTISTAILRLDPVWNPIRKDPRFQALIKKYAPQKQG